MRYGNMSLPRRYASAILLYLLASKLRRCLIKALVLALTAQLAPSDR